MTGGERLQFFFKFLLDTGGTELSEKWVSYKNKPTESLMHGHYSGVISNAFRWKDTPEGYDFWEDINIKWLSKFE